MRRTEASKRSPGSCSSIRQNRELISLDIARENGAPIKWRSEDVPSPAFQGRRLIDDVSLEDIAPYIDWTFFFSAWELKGKFPKILEHERHGAAARELYDHGRDVARAHHFREAAHAPRRLWVLAREPGRRRHRRVER